jgi:hypothetical protein
VKEVIMSTNNYDDLLAQLNESSYDPALRPEPGDTIAGRVVKLTERPASPKGQAYPVIVLETAEGRRAIHVYHRVLRTQLYENVTLAVGDELAIAYDGQRTSESGREYHAYRTLVQPKGF